MSDSTSTIKKAVDAAAAVGMGQSPVEMSHPIHPATVHWPIAFLTGAFTLDVLQHFVPGVFAQTQSGSLLNKLIPPASSISAASHYMNAAGIAFSAISIITGLAEGYNLLENQAKVKGGYLPAIKDAYFGSNEDIGARRLKTTLTHATMNDVTVGIAVYNFYKRAQSPTLALPRGNAFLSAAVLPLFFYSAYLGGSLVYEYGVGVFRQGEAPQIKRMLEKQEKRA